MKYIRQLSCACTLLFLVYLPSLAQSDKFNVTGTWYYFSPEENKMMRSSEYTAYTFSDDSSVSKRTMSEIDRGTYTIDAASNMMTLKFVYSPSDIRSESWRIIAVGEARIFYRRNISENSGFEDDLLYVREKSGGSARRNSTKSKVDATKLLVGGVYEISKDTPLAPELDPADPLAALAKIRTLMAGGQVKIMAKVLKNGQPWYQVAFSNSSSGQVDFGWINSAALLDQNVTRVE